MDYNQLVEILKNKRYRAIFILCLYIIFFIFIASMFRKYKPSVIPENPNKKDPIDTYCVRANYEFTIDYDVDGAIYSIEGKQFRKDVIYTLNDKEYYIKDDVFYIKEEDVYKKTDQIIDFYNIDYICNLVKNGTLVSKSENYEDGSLVYKYSSKDDSRDQMVYVSTNVKDNNIDKVELDLSGLERYVLRIEYKNIGQVSNFTLDFKEGVEE